jgi:hypothetical protein
MRLKYGVGFRVRKRGGAFYGTLFLRRCQTNMRRNKFREKVFLGVASRNNVSDSMATGGRQRFEVLAVYE